MSTTEAVVAKIQDLQDGEMRQVSVGDTPVLLARVQGQFYAMGANCTHYGAPLAKGALSGETVVCPWHNACFNVTTGDHLQPCGLDALPHFEVRIEGEEVRVTVPEDVPQQRTPDMVSYSPEADSRTFVVLGAGAAGTHAVEILRQDGYQGRIVMISGAQAPAYDRTMLTKKYLQGKADEDALPLRSPEFYQAHGIELVHRTVTQVQPKTKTLTFENGETLAYDALLLATGGKPRSLKVPGADLKQVHLLRSAADAKQIVQEAEDAKRAVVIGSSFIGMEAAASLTQRGLQVTVVSPDEVPFAKILGEAVGKLFQTVHEQHGVTFHLGHKATQFEGNGKVQTVVLDNGDRIPADLVVVGIGVQPATDYLQEIDRNDDQSLSVNAHLQVTDGLYAAGDIARFPDPRDGQPIRIEHWRLAAQQGRVAAHNMAGQTVKFKGVPFFWTGQFDLKLRYAGHATDWDRVVIDGSLDDQEFLAFYIKGDQIRAVAGVGRDRDIAAITALMRLDQLPAASVLEQGSVDWVENLKP